MKPEKESSPSASVQKVADSSPIADQRYKIAIHEAGHAAILRGYGYVVDKITLSDDGSEGECVSTQFDDALNRGGARVGSQAVAVASAGRAAVEEFFGTDEGYWMSCITDFGILNYGLEEMQGGIEDCDGIMQETKAMIRAHRDEIESEARTLVSKPVG